MMFRLMNQSVAKSDYDAIKEVKSEILPIKQYKTQAADGCSQCKKIENAYIECQKKLERSERQLLKANDYNEDLRKQIHKLSSELHDFRSKSKNKTDVGVQTDLSKEDILRTNSFWKEDENNFEASNKEENAGGCSEQNLSIVEEIKQAAEEAVQWTGYVYDEATGLYFDKNSGYYYNAETALHYDSHTGTYYTYDSYSGTYIFHSQVDLSYVQPTQGETFESSHEGYYETNGQSQQNSKSFQEYRDPALKTANPSATPNKKTKKRKNKTKKEKTSKVQKVDDLGGNSESLKTENDNRIKTQESSHQKDEHDMEEEGEIVTETDEVLKHSSTTNVSQMDVGEEEKLESQFQINEDELQGLNRKQRREKIRQLKKEFEEKQLQNEEKQLQNESESFQVIEKVVDSSVKVEEYDKVSFTLSSEPEVIETGYSVYGCDELCSSTSGSSAHMEETSVISSIVVSDSSGITITSTCSLQANDALDLVNGTGIELVKKGEGQPQVDLAVCETNLACKECGKTQCKVLNACSVMTDTLYQGNLSDDTQNAVDFDFVSKVKHDNSEEDSLDLVKGTEDFESLKQKEPQSMSCDLIKSVEDPMEGSSSVDASVTSSTLTMKNSTINETESQSLDLVKSCVQSKCEDSEDSRSLCTDESELESGELTDSSEEDEQFTDYDRAIVQVEEAPEDQDPHCLPPCIRLIVMDSDHLDYGSLFVITCDGGTLGREKQYGNIIIIPDINISKIHAQFKYNHITGQYNLADFGSQNGTYLNEQRISEAKCSSDSVPLNHGDIIQVGCTRFLLHIHPGCDTCADCEPGIVQAAFQAQQTKDIPVVSKEEKKKQARQELNKIKKKYGLKNVAYEDNGAVKNPNYQDRAEERRKTKGSDNPYQADGAPASVHRPITESNVGHKLLKKMGWSEGESLGKDNTGIQDPVSVNFRANQKAGLGSTEACSSSLDDIDAGKKSKRWIEAQQRYRKL